MKAGAVGMRSSGALAVMLAACCCPPVVAQAPGPAVSFAKQVAPILVAKCGGCHVAGRKGGFQMASYAGLMQTGVVQAGQGNASRLIEVILSGDMPRGGGTVSPAEVGTLLKWIDAGAGCDVADPTLPLDQVARIGTAPPPPSAPIVATPLERGAVSFATDVAPVLLKECVVCHGAEDAESNLRMTSLATLMEGGRGGAAVTAGKGATSLLVRKLRGREIQGQRMPLNADPLADDVIARIERWIDEGARLDMLAAKTPLETLVAAGRARGMPAAELERLRFEAGRKLWRRALPDEEPVGQMADGVCLIGNLPAARIEQLAATAGPLARRVGKELVADDAPLLRGGVVIYVFRHAYDYSALWQNVIGAERPKGLTGNAGVVGDVAYGAALLPADDDDAGNRELLVAEQIAGAALAGRMFPEWFTRGAARVVAMRVAPKAPLIQEWKRDVSAAVVKLGSAADFLAGRSDPGAATTAAGGFVSAIATGARLRQIVAAVDAGGSFDDSFAKVFRATPQAAFEAWAAREAKRAPRPR
jgi:cytochrome c553